MTEFPCTCTGLDTQLGAKCIGCRANLAVTEARLQERQRCAKVASDAALRYTCRKRRGLCLAIRDQILQQ